MSGTPFAVYDADRVLQISVGEKHVAEWLVETRYPGGSVVYAPSNADLSPSLFDFDEVGDE